MGLLPDVASAPAAWDDRRTLAGAFYIKTDRIQPDPLQPRKIPNPVAQKELVESVRQQGIIQPITVRYLPQEGIYQIITGERRYLAATELGLPEMPCWVQTPADKDILVRQVIENVQRADLHPFDLADSLVQLRDQQGRSQKEIAALIGKPESEVSKTLALLNLNPAIQSEYRRDLTGTISRRHLENIAKLDSQEQTSFLQEVRDRNLTATQTEQVVREKLSQKGGETRRGPPSLCRRKFTTSKATVVVSFQRKNVTVADMLEALTEARQMIKEDGI